MDAIPTIRSQLRSFILERKALVNRNCESQVDRHHPAPLGEIYVEGGKKVDAGVVHQDVAPPEALLDGRRELSHNLLRDHSASAAECLTAGRLDQPLGLFGRGDVRDRHVSAVGRQPLRERLPYAASSARHNSDLTFVVPAHSVPPLLDGSSISIILALKSENQVYVRLYRTTIPCPFMRQTCLSPMTSIT